MKKKSSQKITVVIPALNEEKAISKVIKEIPSEKLRKMGYETEIMVIDNGSTDKTAHLAKKNGAQVIVQPVRGYGNAYKAGFANASGDIIATGDADCTYPFSDLPKILEIMDKENIDFINTNRLATLNRDARPRIMSRTHMFGNNYLTLLVKMLFPSFPFKDSQSGMWIFKRKILPKLNLVSSGMPFSQELKIEAYKRGFKCREVPVTYRARAGSVKLRTLKDGIGNTLHIFRKRLYYWGI